MSEINLYDIREVKLLPYQEKVVKKLYNITNHLFSGTYRNIPFKGFLLYGEPGNGKTEIIKQVAKKIYDSFNSVALFFVDGSDIATPRWGDAEKTLKTVFEIPSNSSEKKIILFDDIESLMLARSSELAKEWHYSINSVMFHNIDFLDPTKVMVFATTNRIDLVDKALFSRLYTIEVGIPEKEDLIMFLNFILNDWGVPNSIKSKIEEIVRPMIYANQINDLRRILQKSADIFFEIISEVE